MRGREYRMADNKKNRKPMAAKTKGLIAVAVMLVLTICLSWLAIAGMKLDGEGVRILRPWLPLTAGSMPQSLTLSLDLGEGNSNDVSYRYTAEPTAMPAATTAPQEGSEIVLPESTTAPEEGNGNSDAVEAVKDAAEEVKETVEGAVEGAAEAVAGAGEAVKDAAEGAVETVKDTAEGAAEAVKDAAEGAVETVKDAAEGAVETVKDAAEGAVETVKDAAEGAVEAVKDAAGDAAEAVSEAVEATPTPAPTAVPAEFRPVVEQAAKIIEKRVRSMGRSANVSVIGNNLLRISYPKYVDVNTSENTAEAIENQAISVGRVQVRDASGTVVLDNSAFNSYGVDYFESTYGAFYRAIVNLTNDARKTVESADQSALTLYIDDQNMGTLSNLYNGGKVYLGMGTYSAASSIGALMVNEPLPVQAVAHNDGTVPAGGSLLTVILIVMWVLFAAACVYMILKNRVAGAAASWSLWLFMIIMFFLIATVALPTLTVLNWIAAILSLACAAYVCICQLKGMDEAIAAGKGARASVRSGFASTLKYVMIVHGGWFVLSLIVMIIPPCREFGYILCCGVLSSLVCTVGLNRLLTPACVIACGSKESSVSAKAGK